MAATEQVEPGLYRVGHTETRDRYPDKDVFVVSGDVLNESSRPGFGNHDYVAESKWYVFKKAEYLYNYKDRSGTGVMDVGEVASQHDTKKAAVKAASSRCTETV
jgi:hypothetical protein